MAHEENKPLTLALPKGRLLKLAASLFEQAGYDISPVFDGSRKLIFECDDLRVLVLRASDVPVFVDYGAADAGICGRDTLLEQGRDLYEPLDLKIGACRMVVAEPIGKEVDPHSQSHIRIVTKYPTITRRYLQQRGFTAEVIKLYGAIELGPLTGLGDRIVDLVESGETLRQNGLVEVETIMPITSRLIVNRAALKLRPKKISALISRLDQVVSNT